MRTPARFVGAPVLIATLALAAAVVPASAGAATRTWVSGVGDDAAPCSRTAPCKTFAGAIPKTDAGGEIDALDSGGFGAVTITKSITINAEGVTAGVLNSFTTGIIVNAPATADVTLRGLGIHGAGEVGAVRDCGLPMGLTGIRIDAARSVRIEQSTISNQAQGGIVVRPSATATKVMVDGVAIRNACGPGIDVAPTGTGSADVNVSHATISNTGVGLRVNGAGRAWLSESTIFGNVIGLQTLGDGTITAYAGTNEIHGNGADGSPTSTIGGPVTGPVGPAGLAGPAGPVGPVAPPAVSPLAGPKGNGPPPPARCKVPKLTGLKRSVATKRLSAAGCRVGKVTSKRTTSKKRVGRVVGQGRKAGTSVARGTKVNLTLGRTR